MQAARLYIYSCIPPSSLCGHAGLHIDSFNMSGWIAAPFAAALALWAGVRDDTDSCVR